MLDVDQFCFWGWGAGAKHWLNGDVPGCRRIRVSPSYYNVIASSYPVCTLYQTLCYKEEELAGSGVGFLLLIPYIEAIEFSFFGRRERAKWGYRGNQRCTQKGRWLEGFLEEVGGGGGPQSP